MAGPGVVVQPPVPRPPRYTLIGAAEVVNEADGHWQNGLAVWPQPCVLPFTQDPCSTGTNRAVTYATLPAAFDRSVFQVIMGLVCTGRSVGADDAQFKQRLQTAFEAVEAFSVEREFEQGLLFPTEPHLTNNPTAPTRPKGDTAQTRVEGLAALEAAIAATGRNGVIHMTPALATALSALQLLRPASGGTNLETILGTVVVPGYGYQGATPQGGTAATGTQEWAYATGHTALRRGQIVPVPDNISQALDRSDNTYRTYVSRSYGIVTDWCVHAAVKIDRAT